MTDMFIIGKKVCSEIHPQKWIEITSEEIELLKVVLHDLTLDGYYKYHVRNDKENEMFINILKKLEGLK